MARTTRCYLPFGRMSNVVNTIDNVSIVSIRSVSGRPIPKSTFSTSVACIDPTTPATAPSTPYWLAGGASLGGGVNTSRNVALS